MSETATEDLAAALRPTAVIDSDSPAVAALVARVAPDPDEDRLERILRLYYAVRDEIRYDPYGIMLDREAFRASHCLAAGTGYCITKAAVLAAAARAIGVPARLGFADVRNHLATPRLLSLMDTDIFAWHGFTVLYLDGRWVKATPAFDLALCERFGVVPLEFDGRTDSVFHPFDSQGRKHMEYVRDRGAWDDLPYEAITADFRRLYSRLIGRRGGDFHAEAGPGAVS